MSSIIWQASPNYWQGRAGQPVRAVVIHRTDGDDLAGALSHLCNPAPGGERRRAVSAHYVIDRDGETVQLVDEGDSAWANGGLEWTSRPPQPIVAEWWLQGINPNLGTISLELVGRPGRVLPDAQRQAAVVLLGGIAGRWSGLVLLGHADISPLTRPRCPGLVGDEWAVLVEALQRGGLVGVGSGMRWALGRLGAEAAGVERYYAALHAADEVSLLDLVDGGRLAWLSTTGKIYRLVEVE